MRMARRATSGRRRSAVTAASMSSSALSAPGRDLVLDRRNIHSLAAVRTPHHQHPSERPRPRRCGKAIIHPLSRKNTANPKFHDVLVKRSGSVPPPVEPWLKTIKGKGPSPSGLNRTTGVTGLPFSTRSVSRNSTWRFAQVMCCPEANKVAIFDLRHDCTAGDAVAALNPARSVLPTDLYVAVNPDDMVDIVAGHGGLVSLPGAHDAGRGEIADRVYDTGLSLVRNSLYDKNMPERIAHEPTQAPEKRRATSE